MHNYSAKSKILILSLLFIFLSTSGFGCRFSGSKVQEKLEPVTLEYWRVFDSKSDFTEIINAYKVIHPNITINYKKLRFEEYEDELLNALAEDRGPDIFSIRNNWMNKYQTKLAPLPETITLAYQQIKGAIKKEVITELKTVKTLSLKDLKSDFVDVVYDDVVLPETDEEGKLTGKDRIYGLPLSVDTLALFYNKDLLNNAGIAQPPGDWDEFKEAVKKLTKFNSKGEIAQSGAAIGTADNIPRSPDIISLLFMQNGTQMVNDNRFAVFNEMPDSQRGRSYLPAEEALRFYTDFASSSTEVYTWNNEMDFDQNEFIQGKTALLFSYSYLVPIIKAQAPKLNVAVAPVPQIQGSKQFNIANYWVEAASKKSKHIDEAWDFIQFAAKAENVTKYLDSAQKPTALRALINEQMEKENVDVFASQVLTAKSWYHGKDAEAMEKILKEMINGISSGRYKSISEILNLAASKVNQTIK